MLECLILGDSIASGIASHRPECMNISEIGISSEKWYKQFVHKIDRPFKTVVISLGTNDWKTRTTAESLYDIRNKIKANLVIWILPSTTLKPTQRSIVKEIANEFNDKILDISTKVGYDGMHPTDSGYKLIADETK